MKDKSDIGIFGLGVMGRNLALNFADKGFSVAVYNRTKSKTAQFMAEEVGDRDIHTGSDLRKFVDLLRKPRAIIILVKAGPPVDAVIDELLPFLDQGDILIDGGNSYYADTDRRIKLLKDKGLLYLGMGISGGEWGARYGPSLMPGGDKSAYERVSPLLETAAAQVNGQPCVAYLGSGSAGHYVKMVHNGIEYGLMQLIAESYDMLKTGLDLPSDHLHSLYDDWNYGELASYLIEITADILDRTDDKTGKPLVDIILDEARQKGTGEWTSQDALTLQVPILTIDTAVTMRNLSGLKDERVAASQILKGPSTRFHGDAKTFTRQLHNALYMSMLTTYSQGMALLRDASRAYNYGLEMETIARIWCGGCIIRAALLEDLRAAYQAQPNLVNPMVAPTLAERLMERRADLARVVGTAAELGIPVPGMMSCLAYYDAYRRAWLPANLIQAQRDYFGAHTYQRTDAEGIFHTEWQHVERIEQGVKQPTA